MKDVEIEIQTRVEKLDKLLEYLDANATVHGDNYQKDEYYSPAHRDFTAVRPVSEWLRIRESKQSSVTYKNWHYDDSGKSKYCDEYESPVENPAMMRKIFEAIDIKPVITIEKRRRTWRYEDYEISVDDITDLGTFVEVEFKGDTSNAEPDKITTAMIAFLKSTGCGKVERNHVGYPFMLLYPDEVKFEEV